MVPVSLISLMNWSFSHKCFHTPWTVNCDFWIDGIAKRGSLSQIHLIHHLHCNLDLWFKTCQFGILGFWIAASLLPSAKFKIMSETDTDIIHKFPSKHKGLQILIGEFLVKQHQIVTFKKIANCENVSQNLPIHHLASNAFDNPNCKPNCI